VKLRAIVFVLMSMTIVFAGLAFVSYEHQSPIRYADVNETYEVRDVYRGYDDGHKIMAVEYYDGDTILIVDNQHVYGSLRENDIIVKRSPTNQSYMHWYSTNTRTDRESSLESCYPRNKYILYLGDDLEGSGMSTHTSHARGGDHDSFIV